MEEKRYGTRRVKLKELVGDIEAERVKFTGRSSVTIRLAIKAIPPSGNWALPFPLTPPMSRNSSL